MGGPGFDTSTLFFNSQLQPLIDIPVKFGCIHGLSSQQHSIGLNLHLVIDGSIANNEPAIAVKLAMAAAAIANDPTWAILMDKLKNMTNAA